MSKSFWKAKTHTQQLERLNIFRVDILHCGVVAYTHPRPPADCRLTRLFRTSSVLLTVPDTPHCTQDQCMSSLDVVSTSLENWGLNEIGRKISVRDV
jgi:hypothetical protein